MSHVGLKSEHGRNCAVRDAWRIRKYKDKKIIKKI